MYLCRKDDNGNGYWVDQKINGSLIESYLYNLFLVNHVVVNTFKSLTITIIIFISA